jgi:hypothetical protein
MENTNSLSPSANSYRSALLCYNLSNTPIFAIPLEKDFRPMMILTPEFSQRQLKSVQEGGMRAVLAGRRGDKLGKGEDGGSEDRGRRTY